MDALEVLIELLVNHICKVRVVPADDLVVVDSVLLNEVSAGREVATQAPGQATISRDRADEHRSRLQVPFDLS